MTPQMHYAAVCHYYNFNNSSLKKEFSNWSSYINKTLTGYLIPEMLIKILNCFNTNKEVV